MIYQEQSFLTFLRTPYWTGIYDIWYIKNRVFSLFDALHVGLVGETKEEARDPAVHCAFSCLFAFHSTILLISYGLYIVCHDLSPINFICSHDHLCFICSHGHLCIRQSVSRLPRESSSEASSPGFGHRDNNDDHDIDCDYGNNGHHEKVMI